MESDTSPNAAPWGPNASAGSSAAEGPPSWFGPVGWPDQYPRTLERPCEGRMLGGVAAGIANYFGVEVTIVRIVLVALGLAGGLGVPIYLAGWLLMPEAGTGCSIAEDLIHHAGQY